MNKILKKIHNSIIISLRLGSTPYYKFLLFLTPYYLYFTRVFGIKTKTVLVRVKFNGSAFDLNISDGSDMAIIKEMFIDEQYSLDGLTNPEVILDIGSNVGYSVIYFRLKYPKAVIYAFEPDPVTFSKLVSNVKKFDNVITINQAISDRCGNIDFYAYPGSSMSSSLIKRVDKQEKITVQTVTLDLFFEKYSIKRADIIKFDVEGYEYRIFSKFDRINMVRNYVGELHLDLIHETEDQFKGLFKGYFIKTRKAGKKRLLLYINKKDE